MRSGLARIAVVLALTLGALALPCGAWYWTGTQEADSEARRIENEALARYRETVQRPAVSLAMRLEALRAAEARRPYFHYQSLYQDPRGASQGVSIVPSPLADGPADPLIRAYFQVDGDGRLTLPTLNEDVPEANLRSDIDAQRKLRDELSGDAARLASAARPAIALLAVARRAKAAAQLAAFAPAVRDKHLQALAWEGEPVDLADPVTQQWAKGSVTLLPGGAQDVQVDAETALANTQANRLFEQVKAQAVGGAGPTPQADAMKTSSAGAAPAVSIRVSGLAWATVSLSGQPSLVALRLVDAPLGRLVQGFVISTAAVEQSLRNPVAAAFVAGVPHGDGEAVVPLTGVKWHVQARQGMTLATSLANAQDVRARFKRHFALGAGLAIALGLGVVLVAAQSERLARQRSQLAAAAAHELRTPLAGIRLHAEMLADGLGDPSRAREYARRVADEAERLARVVANVLGFTRVERGAFNVSPTPGDLAAAVSAAVERHRAALEAAGMHVVTDLEASLARVAFDGEALAQVVSNLLDNAERHTRGVPEREVTVTLRASDDGRAAVLTVADRGPGIPPRDRRRVLRPFERGTRRDAPAGLGLGLALARAVARAHGGDLALRERPGGGTIVAVTVPLPLDGDAASDLTRS